MLTGHLMRPTSLSLANRWQVGRNMGLFSYLKAENDNPCRNDETFYYMLSTLPFGPRFTSTTDGLNSTYPRAPFDSESIAIPCPLVWDTLD